MSQVCEVLHDAGWEQRRAAILTYTAAFQAAGGQGPLVERVRAHCPEDLARQELALRIEEAAREIGDGGRLEAHDPACYGTSAVFWVENQSSSPLGFVVAADGGPPPSDPEDAGDAPWPGATVVWSAPPGDRQLVAESGQTAEAGCRMQASWFIADESSADAAAPGHDGERPPSDDPAAWLPPLLQADLEFRHAPTIDGMARSRDVRGFNLIGRLDQVGSQDVAHRFHPVSSARVCPDATDRPAPDRMAFAYVVEYGPIATDPERHPGYTELQYAAFRLNQDGRWRLLTVPLTLTGSFTAAGCAELVGHP